MVSNVLHIEEVSDMGLYDCGSNLSLDGFENGITVACFQLGGTSPRSHEILNNFISYILVSLGNCLSISYVIVSAPREELRLEFKAWFSSNIVKFLFRLFSLSFCILSRFSSTSFSLVIFTVLKAGSRFASLAMLS